MTNEKDRLDASKVWHACRQNKHQMLIDVTGGANEIARIRAEAAKAEREKQAEIFRIAANAIYFDDSSDYQSALYEIIESLKPGYAPDEMPYFETNEDALAILSDDQEANRG